MGFFDLFRRAPGSAAQSLPIMPAQASAAIINNSPDLDAFLRTGSATASGVNVSAEAAMRNAAVYRCVAIIAGACATLPLSLRRRTGPKTREDADDHSVQKLLRRRPNNWMTTSSFRRMLTTNMLLEGNGYALIVRGLGGRVTDLWPLRSDHVEPVQRDDMSIVYRVTRKNGERIELPQSDILHVMNLTLDGIKGLSVLRYARETIGESLASAQHGQSMFKNGTRMGGLITFPNSLSPEATANLKKSMLEYTGTENAGKNLILEEGADYKPLSLSASDAQWIESRKFSRSEIAMFFGVPPHMLGDTEKATSWGSGIEQQSIGFVNYTLLDYLAAWTEAIDRDLIDEKESDIYSHFNLNALTRGDILTRYKAYGIARQWGWMAVNDILAKEDSNPIENGDIYLQPMNMGAAGDALNQDEGQI